MFQSPLSRGTPTDMNNYDPNVCDFEIEFQSPLSRGTPTDLETSQEVVKSKYLFQSPLSRGTTPDPVT